MEPLNIGKFFSSFFQIMPWIKTLRYTIGAALIIGIALFVYLKFKPQTQKTVFTGSVGSVNIIQDHKRLFIPFIEGGVEKNTAGHRNFDSYIRTGLRFEF